MLLRCGKSTAIPLYASGSDGADTAMRQARFLRAASPTITNPLLTYVAQPVQGQS
jgi:hypothetical protein